MFNLVMLHIISSYSNGVYKERTPQISSLMRTTPRERACFMLGLNLQRRPDYEAGIFFSVMATVRRPVKHAEQE